jgi:FKBP-type peptidyl-prolyl cis-trans isomerase FklB
MEIPLSTARIFPPTQLIVVARFTRAFAQTSYRCDNAYMPKTFTTVLTLLAAGMILLGNAVAQGTSAQSTQPPPTSNAQQAPAKTGQTTAEQSQSNPAFKTEKDKVSYAIGMNVGKNLQRQSIDVDPAILMKGLQDTLSGKTLLTEAEAQAVLMQLQADMRKKQEEKMQQAGEANQKEGEAFLAANKAKAGVVTLPSGLQYKILQEGTGPKPSATDTVVCNYRGTLVNGTEFDSSYKRGQAATFPVNGVIKGWTEALQLMPVGSKWQLVIPAELAYGQRGAGPDIGPNATLIFEVELLSIKGQETKDK